MANDKLDFVLFLLTNLPGFFGQLLVNKIKAIVHSFTYRGPTDKPKTVAVIGGSFAGIQLARRLTQTLPTGWRVVLVERNSHLNYSFNFPRFSVVPGHERSAFIPYDAVFADALPGISRFVQGTVTGLTTTAVQLNAPSGESSTIPYDVVVLATGSASRPPAKLLAAADRDAACAELQALQQRIQKAQNVAIVGGGAVGVELATDIKTYGSKDGEEAKKVTLVHSREQLMNRFHPRLHEHVLATLKQLDIRVVLGQRPEVQLASDTSVPAGTAGLAGTLRFADGHEESFDCVLVCTGMTPNSGVIKDLAPGAIAPSGEISVAPTLQVVDSSAGSAGKPLANVFALGDVAASGGPKMARAAFSQTEVVVANILALARGQAAKKVYVVNAIEGSIKLSLGKDNSAMFLDDGKGRTALMAMGGLPEDMEIKKGWMLVGAKYPKEL